MEQLAAHLLRATVTAMAATVAVMVRGALAAAVRHLRLRLVQATMLLAREAATAVIHHLRLRLRLRLHPRETVATAVDLEAAAAVEMVEMVEMVETQVKMELH